MSQRRNNKNINNNLKTGPGRFVAKCSTRVLNSGSTAHAVDTVLLYRLVFRSKKAVMLAVLLCLCFATQSVKFADASEGEDTLSSEQEAEVVEEVTVQDVVVKHIDEPNPPEEAIVTAPEVEPESDTKQLEPEDVTLESQSEIETETQVSEGGEILSNATTSAQINMNATADVSPATSTSITEPEATSTIETDISLAATTTVDTIVSTTTNGVEPVATTTEVEIATSTGSTTNQTVGSGGTVDTPKVNDTKDDSVAGDFHDDGQIEAEEDASASEDVSKAQNKDASEDDNYVPEAPTTSNENLVFTMESDTHFSFNKNECTRIEDGTFYCQEQDTTEVLEDSLIAAPDSDGDLEIFLVRDGQRYQVTYNEVDDASPYFDELSNTIVWHRLINDRYQIISYDIESGEEEQLTHASVNSMEPARHGEYTVWQRWVENNWEVILYDGTEKIQITQSARHDIAPHIRGPLVIWNSQSNDGSQELRTFDIKSRTQTTIADSEGVSVSNPRMVVMYEAMYENGDVVTKGFDLVSGKIVPLQALPKQLPEELPNSEPTEEVRALIHNKPEPKSTTVSNIQNSGGTNTGTTTPAIENATSSPETLDLRSLSTPELVEYLTNTDTASTSVSGAQSQNEPAATTTQNEALADIPDLVIAPSAALETATNTQNTQE